MKTRLPKASASVGVVLVLVPLSILVRLSILVPLSIVIAACGGPSGPCEDCDPIVALEVSPDTVELLLGETVRLSARFLHQSGASSTPSEVAWIAVDPEVATVDDDGEFEAVGGGIARIVAAARGYTGEAIIDVTSTSLPIALRSGHVAVVGGKLYYIGGDSGYEDYVGTTYIFDPDTKSWTTGYSMPTPRDDGFVAVHDGRIFVIGGVNPFVPNNGYSRLWANEVFDVAAGSWETRAPMPVARAHGQADTLDGKIYVIAGSTIVETYDRVDVYDPGSNSWSSAPSFPRPLLNFRGASIGGRLYMVGGELAPGTRQATGELHIFDPTSGSWSSGPPMPTPRIKPATAVVGNRLFVMGGLRGYTYLDVVEAFDTETGTWETHLPLPVARSEARAAYVQGVIYVLGGLTDDGITSRVDAYIPPD
jgi:N-acetylneuraminic acid mutarotase